MLWRVCSVRSPSGPALSLLVGFIVARRRGRRCLPRAADVHREDGERADRRRADHRARRCRRLRAAVRTTTTQSRAASLHEFLEVNPAVRAITVIELEGQAPNDGPEHVVGGATSGDGGRPAGDHAGRRSRRGVECNAIRRGAIRRPQGDPMAVVVTVSTTAVDRVARDGRLLALYVMLPAIADRDRAPRLARASPRAPADWRHPRDHAAGGRRGPAGARRRSSGRTRSARSSPG